MRFAVAVSLAALAACDQQAPVANNAAVPAANAAADNAASAAPLGTAPATREAALELMHERHEGMEDIGDAFKIVSRELKNDNPDIAKVREGAGTIARLAPQASSWFPPDTGPEVGKTRAKSEIWQKPADFAAKSKEFDQRAQAFNAALRGTDLAAIRAAHGELGKSCKGCHDDYRSEKKIAHD
jgi:cytochrome c556